MDYSIRVARGVALLDFAKIDWRSNINLSILDMSHWKYCILGQVFGSYVEGLQKLGMIDPTLYGFVHIPNALTVWDELAEAWKSILS